MYIEEFKAELEDWTCDFGPGLQMPAPDFRALVAKNPKATDKIEAIKQETEAIEDDIDDLRGRYDDLFKMVEEVEELEEAND